MVYSCVVYHQTLFVGFFCCLKSYNCLILRNKKKDEHYCVPLICKLLNTRMDACMKAN